MEINASEISQILRQRIEGFQTQVNRSEEGTVVSVGDGIATVYGLDQVMYGEMIEFPNGVMASPSTSRRTASARCSWATRASWPRAAP